MSVRELLDRLNGGRLRFRGDLVDLAARLHSGEVMPAGDPGEAMHPGLTEETLGHFVAGGDGELAAAINVALVYGDTTGLDYFYGRAVDA